MDPKAYEKAVDELATMKTDIRDKNYAFKAARRIFEDVFQRDTREFSILSDMKFHRDGFPEQDSTSRLHKLLDKVALMMHWYNFLGDEEIVQYLKTKGIKFDLSVQLIDMQLNADVIDPVEWDDAMGTASAGIPDHSAAVLATLLERMEDLMKEVYDARLAIAEKAEKVQEDEGIKKSYVERAATIRAKQLKNKPIDKDVAKVAHDADSANLSISIFEDKP